MSTDNLNAVQIEARLKEFISQLDEPYRTQALENFDPGFIERIQIYQFSRSGALLCSFYWRRTNQGFDYWDNLFWELRAKELAEQNTTPQQ